MTDASSDAPFLDKYETLGLILLGLGFLATADLLVSADGSRLLTMLTGVGALPFALGLLLIGGYLSLRRALGRWLGPHWYAEALLGFILLWLALLLAAHLQLGADNYVAAQAGKGGGVIGWALAALLVKTLGRLATWGAALLLAIAGLALIYLYTPLRRLVWPVLRLPDRTLSGDIEGEVEEDDEDDVLPSPGRSRPLPAADETLDSPPRKRRRPASVTSQQPQATAKTGKTPARRRSHQLPPLNLLHGEDRGGTTDEQARIQATVIEDTLRSFGIPATVEEINIGPTVTQFGVVPGTIRRGERRLRVRVSKIVSLTDDLALALAASPVRIEAPVPGRPYIGIEVPNPDTTLVSLRRVLEDRAFRKIKSPLAIPMGRDVSGSAVAVDLARLPHLLIAGATGSGKSVALNAIICAMLLNNTADVVRFILIDPKRVELPGYNGIPHLVAPVVTEPRQAEGALSWLLITMDERYRLFAEARVRNIQSYNAKAGRGERLAYLVLVIDELADLMVTAPEAVEAKLVRLAQMARATGIHLLVATQRPSVDVVTGLIKANFPARLAFAVTSGIDSRVILDANGAEKLLGRGDGLLMTPDSAQLRRIQGCFVSDGEINALVHWWQENGPSAERDPTQPRTPWTQLLVDEAIANDVFQQTVDKLRGRQYVTISGLQRLMGVGYPRAAQLMEELEAAGVVGAEEDRRTGRPVLIDED